MSCYEALAASYDGLTRDIPYEKYLRFFKSLLKQYGVKPKTVLDLACGTGSLSVLLAKSGYAVLGVDRSEDMLTVAAEKAMELEENQPFFVAQPMQRLRLPQPVDACVCALDSINYVTKPQDVQKTFCRIYESLRPGGLFVFDINTPYKLESLDGQVFLDETEDSYCVWRTFYAPGRKICTYQVDLFRLNANGSWDRAFEEHRERAWGREELETYLTEAGFGADLGAEKFLDIKCRGSGLRPDAVVIVATVRALKLHGGADKTQLATEDTAALRRGIPNLLRHIENITQVYGLPAVVALNRFTSDTAAELALVQEACAAYGAEVALSEVWEKGSRGGMELACGVLRSLERENHFRFAYDAALPIRDKLLALTQRVYGGRNVAYTEEADREINRLTELGFGGLPVCVAKTQYSLSDDPTKLGAPQDFILTVRKVKVSAGAGFIVALTGDILTMPGLPKTPAAEAIDVDENGRITGLF